MAVSFEGYERRIDKINKVLAENGISSLEEAEQICLDKGVNPREIVEGVQPIAFENAKWAYVCGCAIAIKKGAKSAAEAAALIGEGLQAFCIPGSVAEDRKVGMGHGNLGAMLLRDETECFAFLAGHESFAAAEGAIGIALQRQQGPQEAAARHPERPGQGRRPDHRPHQRLHLCEDPVRLLHRASSRSCESIPYSDGARAAVRCYGADDVREGVAIMRHEGVDVSITGNSTNPTRFQHPVAGTYKKERIEHGKKYFSVASGGGTGRTLHPDNMAAGPASYGMTDTMGRMHSDAQFAGSSSVPAHVEMMGFIGMGNNPMVGATVACAVAVNAALNE